jgi:PAS domain-containing protein
MDAGTKTNDRADQAPDLPSLCHSMFEGSPMPVATVAGAKHIVCYVNPVFCSLVGKSKSELIGNPFAEMVPGDGCLSLLDQVYRTGKAETHTEPEHAEAHPVYWSYAM